MSEGELKKQIRSWTYPKNSAIGDAESLVDTAAKEWPMLTSEFEKMWRSNAQGMLVIERSKWFLKWFGTSQFNK
jgi:hypothetical protein